MYEENFSNRISQLRIKKGVSAREMSLALGQNSGYIHNIESGKALPSMTSFFYICEYLDVTPCEFFNFDSENPRETDLLYSNFNKLSSSQQRNLSEIIQDLVEKK